MFSTIPINLSIVYYLFIKCINMGGNWLTSVHSNFDEITLHLNTLQMAMNQKFFNLIQEKFYKLKFFPLYVFPKRNYCDNNFSTENIKV